MIKKFNIRFLKFILIIGLIPAIPGILIILGPVGVLVMCVFGLVAFGRFRRMVFGFFGGIINFVANALGFIIAAPLKVMWMMFGGVFKSLSWLFNWGGDPVRFMGFIERRSLLMASNTGFLIDGKSARLSEKASYQGLIIYGGTGRGKSSVYPMPNLLNLPPTKPSMVITDPSGELFRQTSGYLASQGYDIQTLDLINMNQSHGYNPMLALNDETDVAEFAHTLIRASNARMGGNGGGDPFWEQAAEKLLRIMTQCLINLGDPQYCNLANLRHLITGFDAHAVPANQIGKIDQFVLNATANDPITFASYEAFTRGNLKTIQSILMTADVALDAIATPQVGALTAANDMDLSKLRTGNTALYVIVNQNQMGHYAFVLNLFYAELFKFLLDMKHAQGNSVWLWLDEAGHLEINQLAVVTTTARQYRVAIAMLLQSISQLEVLYGRDKARVLIENVGTGIHLPGMTVDTARDLEARLGHKDSKPLMSATEIIQMDAGEALFLHSNRLPIITKVKPYFKNQTLNRRAQMLPFARHDRGHAVPNLYPL